MDSPEAINEDWRVFLMLSIQEYIKEKPALFVPLVWSWSNDEKNMSVPPLRDVIKAEKDKLPHIYIFNPNSNEAFEYPDKLDDPQKVSPALIMAWAQKTVTAKEIELLEKRLLEYDDDKVEEEKKLTAEQKPKVEAVLERMRGELKEFR